MKSKYIVRLNEEERGEVQAVLSSNAISKSMKKRASILLLADNNAGKPMTQEEMCLRCGVSDVTVYKTLRDFCTNGLKYTLKFKRTKTTNQPIVTGNAEAKIIALACGEPPNGFARWTIQLLTGKVIELNILDKVSRETIRNTLKKRNLSLT